MDWKSVQRPDGSVELRMARQGGCMTVGFAVLALLWTSQLVLNALRHRGPPLHADPYVSSIIEILLVAMTLWCAVGYESFVIRPNSIERLIGFRSVHRVTRYSNGRLEILQKGSTQWGVPYYRLFVVVDSEMHFLMQRPLSQLRAVSSFIAARTGWRLSESVTII